MIRTQPIEGEEEEHCASIERTANFTNKFVVPGHCLRDFPFFVIAYDNPLHVSSLEDHCMLTWLGRFPEIWRPNCTDGPDRVN